jgi:RNA polymerase sigma-70 factor (ECF subfamily)
MDEERHYTELVKQAQLGDTKSLDNLAALAWGRLYAYVYRMVLKDDLAQDIVQESMLEMFRIFGELERADRFWPWLRGIAFNRIRRHRQNRQHRREVPMSHLSETPGPHEDGQPGLAELVGKEIREIVFGAMEQLQPRYRQVLAMRCYEEMDYSEIAELLSCSELSARVLFYRAKRALQKGLSRKGFGSGFVVTALVLFGKMTAPSKAAAAQVTVTAATTKVGVTAALVGAAGSKSAVLSVAAAGAITVGAVVATSGPEKTMGGPGVKPTENTKVARLSADAKENIEECWYYFPESTDGPVMTRLMKSGSEGARFYCEWRQNDRANYHYDKRKNAVYIENFRMWREDLSVWRLPTDGRELTEFLSEVEGRSQATEYVAGAGQGLLVISRSGIGGQGGHSKIIREHRVLEEEYFRYDWPAGVKRADNRDVMHKRGWTYFRVAGEIAGEKISGVGRMPFVYAAGQEHWAWLRLDIGNRLKIADDGEAAVVYDGSGMPVASYAGGSFLKGLARPWMGLHTIDTVRRDAAQRQVRFETEYNKRKNWAQVVLSPQSGKVTYTIDMEKDVVETIRFSMYGGRQGELRFSYLQDMDEASDEFAEPSIDRSGGEDRESPGILWLVRLAGGDLMM